MQITAAVLRENHAPFTIETLSLAAPGPGDVLVAVAATGICHTDLVVRDGHMPTPVPVVLGHEGAGVVAAVGDGVTHVAPGDHVVMSYLSCGGCRCCAQGQPAYCEGIVPLNFSGSRADGTSPLTDQSGARVNGSFFGQSSFASHALASARNVVKVRQDVDLKLLGPLGCGLLTGAGSVINVLQPGPGHSFVVYGAGAVGLSAVMAAKATGVAQIIAVDQNAQRLSLARDLGADHILDTRETPDLVGAVMEITQRGADFALETTAAPDVLRAGVDALAIPGKLGFVGAAATGAEVALDMQSLMLGRQVVGIVEGDAVPEILIPHLVELYRAGRFPLEKLTAFYPLTDINQAVADAQAGRVVKPVLIP
jgi:aryl-alcohol dehydrogenase